MLKTFDFPKFIWQKIKKSLAFFCPPSYTKKVLFERAKRVTPGWCNGSTGDSGSSSLGSSPSPGAIFLSWRHGRQLASKQQLRRREIRRGHEFASLTATNQ